MQLQLASMSAEGSVAGQPARAGSRRGTQYSLIASVLLAWAVVILGPDGMGGGLLAFVAAWTAMMVAMMLPSAAPLVLLYRRGASGWQTFALACGYLLIWSLAGVPAYYAHALLPMSVGPVALAAAGIYQLSPLKAACLRACRSPADFLIQRWGRSPLRLGAEHGWWCLGCCWALMVVLVLAGSMGLPWVVGISTLVAVEKLSRHGTLISRISGVALLIAAAIQGVMLWNGESMEMS